MADMKKMAERVRLAKDMGFHPMHHGPTAEGLHYTVLAYTDWADMFVPTVVRWEHNDEVDDLTDPEATREHAQGAIDEFGYNTTPEREDAA